MHSICKGDFNMLIKDRSTQITFIDKLTAEGLFHEPVSSDFAEFEKYRSKIVFGDLSFTACYMWSKSMHYRIRTTEAAIFIIGICIDGEMAVYILFNEASDSLLHEILLLKRHFDDSGFTFQIECVSEQELKALLTLPLKFEILFDDDFSDYIYDNTDFLTLNGKLNKTKRHEYDRFIRNHPDAVFTPCSPSDVSTFRDCKLIFDSWCSHRSCDDCLFGCEKKAFARTSDIFDSRKHIIGIVHENGTPLSFGFGDFISDECVFFHTQKNAGQMDGLTYFLHRNMAEYMHPNAKYINWGEDMGIEGIRRNKSRYHPIELRRKYKIKF